jgi:hypothetical protein
MSEQVIIVVSRREAARQLLQWHRKPFLLYPLLVSRAWYYSLIPGAVRYYHREI